MTLGAIGTFLFFASLSGFFLRLLQKNKKRYYKGLNMFILRQINSKINTAHISMSFICLMLFCTIGILSTGLGATDALNQGFKYSVPFDASFRAEGDVNIAEEFKKYDIDLSKYTDRYHEYHLYKDSEEKLTMRMILEKIAEILPDDADLRHMEWPLRLIRLSDYNELTDMQGFEEASLPEGHVAVYSDYAQVDSGLKEALLKYIKGKYSLTISGENHEISPDLLTNGIITSPNSSIILALVVPDQLVQGCKVDETILSFNCSGNRKETQIRQQADPVER